jgi:uroporphyrinogen-III decarboxylase
MVLYGSEKNIKAAVEHCIHQANGKHVLNLGHGVEKDTPESAVAAFVNAAREVSQKYLV